MAYHIAMNTRESNDYPDNQLKFSCYCYNSILLYQFPWEEFKLGCNNAIEKKLLKL